MEDPAERVRRAERETPPEVLWALSRPTIPKTLSEAAGDQLDAFRFVMRQFDFAKDGLGVSTLMSSAMRKLGVQTRAQLIKKLRDFRTVTDA